MVEPVTSNSYDNIDVTVILPTKNEPESIAECIEKARKALRGMNLKYEIIVSDSSTDDTPEIARRHGAKVVHPDRLGYGYAYIYALRHARGKWVVMADGDGTYDLEEAPRLLEPLIKGEADLVLGTRLKGRIMPGAMPWLHRYIGNPLLTFILNKFYGITVSDAHTGFRAFTREAIAKIRPISDGMEFASELLIKAAYAKLRIVEVPITYYPRKGAPSKLRSFRDGWRHLILLLILAPKFLYYVPATILNLTGITLLLAVLMRANLGYLPGIHSSILGGMMVLLGYNLAFTGFLTDIHLTEILGRPTSRITTTITRHFSIEKTMLAGVSTAATGATYLLYLFIKWIESGYQYLPLRGENVVALTLFIIGIQIIFHALSLHLFLHFRSNENGGNRWEKTLNHQTGISYPRVISEK